jgi:hypothetical protein
MPHVVLRELREKRRVRRLHGPRSRRRAGGILPHGIERVRGLDDADLEQLLPEVVDGRARELRVARDEPAE